MAEDEFEPMNDDSTNLFNLLLNLIIWCNTDEALQAKNHFAGSESVYTLCRAVGTGTTGPT